MNNENLHIILEALRLQDCQTVRTDNYPIEERKMTFTGEQREELKKELIKRIKE